MYISTRITSFRLELEKNSDKTLLSWCGWFVFFCFVYVFCSYFFLRLYTRQKVNYRMIGLTVVIVPVRKSQPIRGYLWSFFVQREKKEKEVKMDIYCK